jgi:DNA segregation ATPase FtsK/SpoIIIE, S-DNA-T family
LKTPIELAAEPPETPAVERESRIGRELSALTLMAIAVFGILSLVSFDLAQKPNLGGPLGAALAGALSRSLGFHSYFLAAMVICFAARVWIGTRYRALGREALGGLMVLLALACASGFWSGGRLQAGGAIGLALATPLGHYLNVGGGYLVVMLTVICGLALMFRRAPTDLVAGLKETIRSRAVAPSAELADRSWEPVVSCLATDRSGDEGPENHAALRVRRIEPIKSEIREHAALPVQRGKGGYKVPPLSLLDAPPQEDASIDETMLERSARLLEQKLADFGVQGQVVEVQPGPVVTMYKFEPGSGIKVSQIVNLADDLSMALRASAVRILAPVPGEAVVGIEVPNRKREKVYLREILEASEFNAAKSHLVIALGKNISGQPAAADLALMPHLLIAGATGTGKSVSIHAMIASILFNTTADDVRFILIDPKMLELSVYEGIPHLLVPVVVDPQKAASALLWATQEMEERYRVMRDLGVRNIDGYNRALSGRKVVELKPSSVVSPGPDVHGETSPAPDRHRKLPRIVIVIDELADLLLSEGKTVERDITRLAQKARAAGIHLILATQRPSVDVITGLIKANLPARISFQVTSRVDSRTILDSIGAERLLGAGDMLFMPPGTARLRRLHGPFVSEHEIHRLAEFLRAQGAPDYRMEILETKQPGQGDDDGADGEHDEMYDEAVRIVMETNQASISMIQRRLRVGYNRAARMVEQMEREGLVTPPDGARPREVRIVRGAH